MKNLATKIPEEPNDLMVRVITPHDGSEAFRDAFLSILRDWRFSRELAWRIFVRDTKASFRGSFLGGFWVIFPVLINSLVWMFLSGTDVVRIETGQVPYPLFVLVGNLLWTAFNSCFVGGLGVLLDSGGTLSKVNFPHEALLLVVFWKSLLSVGLSLLALPPFLLFFPLDWQWSMLLFPIGILLTMCCGISLGLIMVPVATLFSDLNRIIHLGLRFLFFLTPVIFPLPEQGVARWLMIWNPVTPLLVSTRASLLGGESVNLGAVTLVSLACFPILLLGVVALKVAVPHIIERLGGG